MITSHFSFWDDFQDPLKVTFDGENKTITVNPQYDFVSVRTDIYSAYKRWVQRRDNSKYLPAIRTTGGDPVGAGTFSGDIYFLINDWIIILDHTFEVDGSIFSDNYPSPYVQEAGTFLVLNRVSALVQTVEVGGGSGSTITTSDIWNHPTRTLTQTPAYNGPTPEELTASVWSDPLAMKPEDLWEVLLNVPMIPGSAGDRLKQSLTIANFLALK